MDAKMEAMGEEVEAALHPENTEEDVEGDGDGDGDGDDDDDDVESAIALCLKLQHRIEQACLRALGQEASA